MAGIDPLTFQRRPAHGDEDRRILVESLLFWGLALTVHLTYGGFVLLQETKNSSSSVLQAHAWRTYFLASWAVWGTLVGALCLTGFARLQRRAKVRAWRLEIGNLVLALLTSLLAAAVVVGRWLPLATEDAEPLYEEAHGLMPQSMLLVGFCLFAPIRCRLLWLSPLAFCGTLIIFASTRTETQPGCLWSSLCLLASCGLPMLAAWKRELQEHRTLRQFAAFADYACAHEEAGSDELPQRLELTGVVPELEEVVGSPMHREIAVQTDKPFDVAEYSTHRVSTGFSTTDWIDLPVEADNFISSRPESPDASPRWRRPGCNQSRRSKDVEMEFGPVNEAANEPSIREGPPAEVDAPSVLKQGPPAEVDAPSVLKQGPPAQVEVPSVAAGKGVATTATEDALNGWKKRNEDGKDKEYKQIKEEQEDKTDQEDKEARSAPSRCHSPSGRSGVSSRGRLLWESWNVNVSVAERSERSSRSPTSRVEVERPMVRTTSLPIASRRDSSGYSRPADGSSSNRHRRRSKNSMASMASRSPARRLNRGLTVSSGISVRTSPSEACSGFADSGLLGTLYESDAKLDKYIFDEMIGTGGQGTVHRVMDTDRQVYALKRVWLPGMMWAKDFTNNLRNVDREVRLLRSLAWASSVVVKVHDCWIQQDFQSACIVMEWLPVTLAHILTDCSEQSATLDHNDMTRWIASMATGLAAIHSLNFMHRDIKPQNILFTEDLKQCKLADLGIGRAANGNWHQTEDSDKDSCASVYTEARGTMGYMSPEVLDGHAYNLSADVYSLGCVSLQLLAVGWRFQDAAVLNAAFPEQILPLAMDLARSVEGDDDKEDLSILCLDMLAKESCERPTALAIAWRPALAMETLKLTNDPNLYAVMCPDAAAKLDAHGNNHAAQPEEPSMSQFEPPSERFEPPSERFEPQSPQFEPPSAQFGPLSMSQQDAASEPRSDSEPSKAVSAPVSPAASAPRGSLSAESSSSVPLVPPSRTMGAVAKAVADACAAAAAGARASHAADEGAGTGAGSTAEAAAAAAARLCVLQSRAQVESSSATPPEQDSGNSSRTSLSFEQLSNRRNLSFPEVRMPGGFGAGAPSRK
eukprot:TRINITY_DN24511_c0_g3_i5.p1 TRINITY_DN24511_c0_g3~~TRINITY_DN24511_c0_g3_i5.p1  ORF type:complete len:1092 (+),score=179.12 TRINITY_DN24511_c0_g3_i5:169-3444(+)